MDIEVIIERHEQKIQTLERDMSAMKIINRKMIQETKNSIS